MEDPLLSEQEDNEIDEHELFTREDKIYNMVIRARKMAAKTFTIVIVLSCYCGILIQMIFANKSLVGERDATDVTILVGWLQCISTICIGLIIQSARLMLNHLKVSVFRITLFELTINIDSVQNWAFV